MTTNGGPPPASPLPELDGPHQPGITDPQWGPEPPPGIDPGEYQRQYAGRVDRQSYLAIAVADIHDSAGGNAGLGEALAG